MRISMSRTNLSHMDLLSKSPLNCQSLRHTLDSNFGMTGSKTERLKLCFDFELSKGNTVSNFGMTGSKTERLKLCFDFELSKGNRGQSHSLARARGPKANPSTDLPPEPKANRGTDLPPEPKANPGTDHPRYPIHPLTQTLVRRLMGMEALKIKAAYPEVKTLT